jgi:hypothetical protein
MPLSADQLFQPAPSGVSLNPNTPPAAGSWLALLIQNAQLLNLPTTAWQPGGPERTIDAMMAVAFARSDVLISMMAQGGFLDFAASGTVTATALDGTTVTQPVTPDPSIASQNPTGVPGWLDALGQSFYSVFRLLATYASGQLAIANTTAGTLTYAAANYHVANTSTNVTYSNVSALTVPPSALPSTNGQIVSVTPGTSTTIGTNTAHGLSPNQTVYITGVLGITGLTAPTFALVTSTPTTTSFTIDVATSGSWTGGGTVYLCTVATMAADAKGIASNAAPGQVTTTVTQTNGVFVDNLTAWSAANFESNPNYAGRCRLKLGALSPNGPAQAYQYFALTAQQILAAEVPAITLTNGPIAKAITYAVPATKTTNTVISSSTPASVTLGGQVTPGCAQLAITGATNASPIAITTASAHGLSTGNNAIISGVLGNTAANGAWVITKTGANTFTLNTSVGNGAYTGGGFVEGGDLGEVDNLIQANVVPDDTTAVTQSSLAFPIAVVATVVVPNAYVASYQAAAAAALVALLATYPIGGNIPPGGSNGTIPISAIEGALIDAGVLVLGGVSFVRQVSNLTINASSVDLNYPSPNHDALLTAPTITVIGV